MNQPNNSLRKALLQTEGALHQEVPKQVEDEPKPEPTSKRCPSRQGKKVIMGFFDKNTHKQMKLLTIEREVTMEKLLEEAVLLYLEMHNMLPTK